LTVEPSAVGSIVRAPLVLALAALPFFGAKCSKGESNTPKADRAPAASASAPASEGPIRVEPLEGQNPPVYVLRGTPRGPEKLVFLHGMCGHGLGYAQSFQRTAATIGTLIAPQADVPCGGGPWAKWSKDIAALDARIVTAFRALGQAEPVTDIIVIGYSQGATRAESLAQEFPERYTRLVLMGGPVAAKARGLETLRAAVAMAGDRDRKDLMQASAKTLSAAGVPATFMIIPDAPHGSMGSRPEETMSEVFGWLGENQRSTNEDGGR
jgi:pimeloyl-ACP methyl ester carboxylesterase